MKQLARKSNHISLVPPATEQESDQRVSAQSLNEFFDGWLSSVEPAVVLKPDEVKQTHPKWSLENGR